MKKRNKIILIIGVFIIIVGGIFIYQGFIKEEPLGFTLEKVFKGNVYQEIVEVGIVKPVREIDLNFQNPGRIEEIYVKVGQRVEAGQVLARIDIDHFEIQLESAKAGLTMAQAKFDKLLAGASQEKIEIAKTAISNAQINLSISEQKLKDVKTIAVNSLNQAHQNALNLIKSTELQISQTFDVIDLIQRRYFTANDQASIRIRHNEMIIEQAKNNVVAKLNIAQNNPSEENVNFALLETREALEAISTALAVIREICEEPAHRKRVTTADKASIDAQRIKIQTSLTNIIDAQQAIISIELTNEANINTAQSTIYSAKGLLKLAQNELALLIASPQQEKIDLHQAEISQIKANIELIENQIQDAVIRSPITGTVTEIYQEEGEMALLGAMPIISLISDEPFQIKVDVFEEDIVKIDLEDLVEIDLIAFPDEIFKGKVVSIDPTERLIGGVVHYRVIIDFIEKVENRIKPGMTADITIKTAFRENVLIIDEDAIIKRNNRYFIEVYRNGLIEEREIEIGLQGEDDKVEIISGLKQGEQVVIQ